jgi:hypothetical protein
MDFKFDAFSALLINAHASSGARPDFRLLALAVEPVSLPSIELKIEKV